MGVVVALAIGAFAFVVWLVTQAVILAFQYWFVTVPVAGAAGFIWLKQKDEAERRAAAGRRQQDEQRERDRVAREEAARRSAKERLRRDLADLGARSVTTFKQTVDAYQLAGFCLDEADEYFKGGYLNSFWDAIDQARTSIDQYQQRLVSLSDQTEKFQTLASGVEGNLACPVSVKDVAELRDTAEIGNRLKALVLESDRFPAFVNTLNQRTTIQVLREGFGSVREGLAHMTSRLDGAMSKLERTVRNSSSRMEAAMSELQGDLAEQRRAWAEQMKQASETLKASKR